MCACCVLSPIIVIGSIGSCFFHWFFSYGILQESKRVISEEYRRPFTIFNSKPPSTPTLSLSNYFFNKDLKDLMRKAGEVTFADCHKDRHGEGVVEFSSYEDMKNAIKKLDDTELKGKHIILREAPDNDVDRERRRNSRSRSKSPHRRRSLSHSPPRRRRSSSRSKSPVSNGKDNGSRSPSPHPRNDESPKRSSEPPHEEEDKEMKVVE